MRGVHIYAAASALVFPGVGPVAAWRCSSGGSGGCCCPYGGRGGNGETRCSAATAARRLEATSRGLSVAHADNGCQGTIAGEIAGGFAGTIGTLVLLGGLLDRQGVRQSR